MISCGLLKIDVFKLRFLTHAQTEVPRSKQIQMAVNQAHRKTAKNERILLRNQNNYTCVVYGRFSRRTKLGKWNAAFTLCNQGGNYPPLEKYLKMQVFQKKLLFITFDK